MYSFIYYYIYKLTEKRNHQARSYSGFVVCFAQFGHILLLGAILKRFLGVELPKIQDAHSIKRLYLMPIFAIWITLVVWLFYKRFFLIKQKFEGKNIVTATNAIVFVLLVIVPYLIGAILLSKVN